jgi:hypothetical protein
MKILQQSVKVKRGSRVLVKFSKPTNIYLMTEVNFKRYKDGASFRRLGGEYKQSPAEFVAPYDGTWHAVIERGSHFNPIDVTGSVEVLPPLRKETPYFVADDAPTPAFKEEEVIEDNRDTDEEEKEDEDEEKD